MIGCIYTNRTLFKNTFNDLRLLLPLLLLRLPDFTVRGGFRCLRALVPAVFLHSVARHKFCLQHHSYAHSGLVLIVRYANANRQQVFGLIDGFLDSFVFDCLDFPLRKL